METLQLFACALSRGTHQSLAWAAHELRALDRTRLWRTVAASSLVAAGVLRLWSPAQVASTVTFVVYWLTLGILSSIGMGSGVATFVWFLAPLVVQTALSDRSAPFYATLWRVKAETFWWGLGTAIGELPPFFVARAARRSGQHVADLLADEADVHDPLPPPPTPADTPRSESTTHTPPAVPKPAAEPRRRVSRRLSRPLSSSAAAAATAPPRLRQKLMDFLQAHVGFSTILFAASIPNPLFDMVGLYAGYFLVPLSHFFLAVAIGKSCVKNFLQAGAVALVFADEELDRRVDAFAARVLPRSMATSVGDALRHQAKVLSGSGASVDGDERASSTVALVVRVWNAFLVLMLLWFASSVVLSVAEFERQRRKREAVAGTATSSSSCNADYRASNELTS